MALWWADTPARLLLSDPLDFGRDMAADPDDVLSRLETLGREVAEIRERVGRIEALLERTAAAEPAPAPATVGGAAALGGTSSPQLADMAAVVSLIGRALLALGGAYLLRALSDAALALPAAMAGLAYAACWFAVSDGFAARGRRLSAICYGLVAIAIAYPLLLESTLRMRLFSPTAAMAAVVAFFAAGLLLAERRRLEAIAWINTSAAVLALLVLQVGTRALLPFAWGLLCVAAIVESRALYGRWLGLRWPASLALNLAVALTVGIAARQGGPPEGYAPLRSGAVAALGLSLTTLFVVSVVLRTLALSRAISGFEIAQLPAALLLGLGGALRALAAGGYGSGAVALSSLLLGAAFSLAAFLVIERRAAPARNFYAYSTIGAVLTLAGTGMLLDGLRLTLTWCGLAAAAVFVGCRFDRATLRVHGVGYVLAAALQAGLLANASDALLAPAAASWPHAGPGAFLAIATLLSCYALLAAFRSRCAATLAYALTAGLAAALGLWSVAGLAVASLGGVVMEPGPGADAALLALVRTVVLAGAASAVSWAARRFGLAELSWIAYAGLVGTGLKLVAEDFRVGRPATLFPALAVYGGALIVAPLLRKGSPDRIPGPLA